MLPEFKFHHIGVAVRDIERTARFYLAAGYSMSPVTYDPIQNIHITFLSKEGMPVVELLAPHDENSPVNQTLQKNGVTPYHSCYMVPNMEDAIQKLKKMRYIPVSKPAEAVAIDGHRVCFLFNKDVGLIEIVEE